MAKINRVIQYTSIEKEKPSDTNPTIYESDYGSNFTEQHGKITNGILIVIPTPKKTTDLKQAIEQHFKEDILTNPRVSSPESDISDVQTRFSNTGTFTNTPLSEFALDSNLLDSFNCKARSKLTLIVLPFITNQQSNESFFTLDEAGVLAQFDKVTQLCDNAELTRHDTSVNIPVKIDPRQAMQAKQQQSSRCTIS